MKIPRIRENLIVIFVAAFVVFFAYKVFADEHVCAVPYECHNVVGSRAIKIFKFTSRSAYETWLNAGDRTNCDPPFYSTSTAVEVVCYEALLIKECKDNYGICLGG